MGWTVWDSISGEGEIFCTIQNGPGAHTASYTMGTESCQELQQLKHGVEHPTACSAKFKERAELYLYCTFCFMACYWMNFFFTLIKTGVHKNSHNSGRHGSFYFIQCYSMFITGVQNGCFGLDTQSGPF
jgi:hypothetical protein